jgi:predicted nucleic acid-binding protein
VNGFLLDTNIISELTKPVPLESVLTFLAEGRDFWISTVTLHELAFGIGLMPEGKRRAAIAQTIKDFTHAYQDYTIAVEQEEAHEAALLRAQAQRSGRTVSLGDALIAGTAQKHGLVVATRNIADFEPLGIQLVNPWVAP